MRTVKRQLQSLVGGSRRSSDNIPIAPYRADPANNDVLGTVPEMGLAETKAAIDSAHQAFASWSTTTAKVCL
jgi:acyl-CoA reductase-like NAD-dependent aldehyde dehydrogenase